MHAEVPVRARRKSRQPVNSLDPQAKRFRAADRSLQQARQALTGVKIALADIPRSNQSPITAAIDSVEHALANIAEAASQIDEARLEDGNE